MEVKIKNRGGLRVSNALMWVLAVLSGTALGIIGSFAVAVSAMSDYREMYKQWIGMDTEITSKEMQENLAWIENSPWVVNFADENAQSDLLGWLLLALVALVIVFCAALIVLCVQTGRLGRAADGSIQLNRFDRVWSEVLLVLGCGGGAGCAAVRDLVSRQHQGDLHADASERLCARSEQYGGLDSLHQRHGGLHLAGIALLRVFGQEA